MHIAVIGATGMLGQPVAHELIKAGLTVRILARDTVAAQACFPGVEIVYADLQDPASLQKALLGMDAVYLNLSIKKTEKQSDFHTEKEGLTTVLQAAQQVGIRRVAYLASIIIRYQGTNGFDWWVFKIKQEAVQRIKNSGIPYTIFYPSSFMESLLQTQRIGPVVMLVGRSATRPWYIAAHDYGRQVVRALQVAQDGENQEYSIQGPEAITQHEAVDRLVAAYKPKRLFTLTVPPSLLRLGSSMSPQADYGWHITEALNKYPEQFEASQTWADLGKPQTTIEQFAEQSMA